MAEYWKSQARKFCDFCKCWIADNKPSIEYHEGGKKHKENVAKRLKEIHKNSAKQAKQQIKYENDLDKMEKAAMAAYLKDVESNNRDMMANTIILNKHNKTEESKKEEKEPKNFNHLNQYDTLKAQSSFIESNYLFKCGVADIDPLDPYAKQKLARLKARQAKMNKELKNRDDKSNDNNKSEKEKSKNKLSEGNTDSKPLINKLWYEAKAQGHSYYWNIETNESVWEPPAEGFKSLEEQAEEVQEQAIQEKFLEEIDKEEEKTKMEILEEQRANAEREKFKEIRTQFLKNQKADNENETNDNDSQNIPYLRNYDIPEKPQPYGSWQVVKKIEVQQIDLQLPQVKAPVPTISFEEPPQQKVFKEKIITHISIGDSDDEGSTVSFKKRKFGNKNVRKRKMDD